MKKDCTLEDMGRLSSTLIKTAMTKHQINAPQLARMLTDAGEPISPATINNRLNRGNAKASWFLLVLKLIGENSVQF